jgi:hypothetical protein
MAQNVLSKSKQIDIVEASPYAWDEWLVELMKNNNRAFDCMAATLFCVLECHCRYHKGFAYWPLSLYAGAFSLILVLHIRIRSKWHLFRLVDISSKFRERGLQIHSDLRTFLGQSFNLCRSTSTMARTRDQLPTCVICMSNIVMAA